MVLIALLGTWSVLLATSRGAGISPDSTVYIGMARHWLNRVGFTFVEGAPGDVPPLYPLTLASTGIITGDPATAAPWLNASLFGANLLLVGRVLRQLLGAESWLSLVGAGLMLATVDMLTIHAMAWSEPIFLFFGLSGLVLTATYLRMPRRWTLVLAALAIGASALARYVGLAFVLTGVMAIVFVDPRPRYRKLAALAFFAALATGPLAVWMLYRPTASKLVFHPPSAEYWRSGLETVSAWLIPNELPIPGPARGIVVLLALSGILALMLIAWRNRAPLPLRARNNPGDSKLAILLALFVPGYLTTMLVAKFLFRGDIPLDLRLLAPLFVPALALTLVAFHRALTRARERSAFGIALVVIVCVWVLIRSYAAVAWVMGAQTEGLGYSSWTWQQSEILSEVRGLPEGTKIYSNGSDAIYYIAAKPASRLPDKFDGMNLIVNDDYAAAISRVRTRLAQGNAVIVYLNNFPERWFQPSEADLKRDLPLRLVVTRQDGAIYEFAP